MEPWVIAEELKRRDFEAWSRRDLQKSGNRMQQIKKGKVQDVGAAKQECHEWMLMGVLAVCWRAGR